MQGAQRFWEAHRAVVGNWHERISLFPISDQLLLINAYLLPLPQEVARSIFTLLITVA
jgi:hypothetical protein